MRWAIAPKNVKLPFMLKIASDTPAGAKVVLKFTTPKEDVRVGQSKTANVKFIRAIL